MRQKIQISCNFYLKRKQIFAQILQIFVQKISTGNLYLWLLELRNLLTTVFFLIIWKPNMDSTNMKTNQGIPKYENQLWNLQI